MTTVVTGAAGHIGANLVRALLTRHRPVRALVHVSRQAVEGLDVEVIAGDIRDLEFLCGAFEGADVVYHLAADVSLLMSGWPRLEAVNVIGTRNVVEACLRCGVRRLIYFGSVSTMPQEPVSIPVESRHCPLYDRSKAAGEREVRKGITMGLDAVIINPSAIIGPHDYRPSHFGGALLAMVNGRLPALVPGGFDWVDVRDIVEGAIRAEERAPTGASYLLLGHWVSLCELAAQVEELTGVPAPKFICPMWLARIGAPVITAFDCLVGRRPLYTSVSLRALRSDQTMSHERATEELGYHPRPFRETLIDTLLWFEEAGRLARPLGLEPAGDNK